MKADEIRTFLRNWSQEDLLKLYTQTYRRLPKDVKEEIDLLIQQGMPAKGEKAPKVAKKAPQVDLDTLAEEIETFIDNAREGKYYYANRTVSKKERSNWRFTVKRFIKDLSSIEPDNERYDDATCLLFDLYNIMGRGCSFYTFSSQDPYHAVGYSTQESCFSEFCDRVKQGHMEDDTLTQMLITGCNGNNDRETVDQEIHNVIYAHFDHAELERILQLALKAFEPVKSEYETMYKGQLHFMITEEQIISHSAYDSFVWFIAGAYVKLGEVMKAYDYIINEIHPNTSREIDLYCLLTYYCRDTKDWIAAYERAIEDGIKPRDHLREQYEKKKQEA